jgi:DNA-directed RNA polymerase subunit N (RpoN/RPB10)
VGDTWLRYVPTDPKWQPTPDAAAEAALLLVEYSRPLNGATDVECEFFDEVELFHPIEMWEGVRCPACGADIEDWWYESVGTANEKGFSDLAATTPCCRTTTTLNDVGFIRPAAFGKFALSSMNPTTEPTREQDAEVARRLGAKVRKVWTHL